ncbi:MAG: cytochrome c maturation protein CcmE [Nannocystaceae bacterium]|nr:cytochrome c maturation protein CcmE [bacterium]
MALNLGSKIGIGVVIAGAVGYLVFSDPGEGVLEYVYAEKVVATPQKYQGRTIQVHGNVVEGSISKKKGTTGDYRFTIESAGERLDVHFTNIPPDTFQEGGEVVLTGRLNEAGTLFESDEMSAKCPSKYEEEESVKQPGSPAPGRTPSRT